MSLSAKRVLMAVILAAALGCAFYASYTVTGKLISGEEQSPAASVTAPEPGIVTSPDSQQSAQSVTQEGLSQTETAPVTTTAAPETTVPVTEPETAPPAGPQDVTAPTYIRGILVVNKSYPLPKDYDPGGLTSECDSAFDEMQAAAAEEGLSLYVASGFRSYDLQASLYQRYCNQDGQAAADTYSARPGHSEHQSGLAIDLNTISSSFAYTEEGKWVNEHCWEYGFILRYPEDKVAITGYMYEPWHIRYVGKDTAAAIYQSGLCLEEYLGIDSVYSY